MIKNAYRYQPLLKGTIRLLRLDPQSNDKRLTGSIFHTSLKNPTFIPPSDPGVPGYLQHDVAYEAISYHWGRDETKPFKLTVENSVIGLSDELHAILQTVVHPTEERVIWVDAICINQVDSNSKEKEEQIRLMPDIYRIAQRVRVHLGRKADHCDLAIQHINHLAKDEYVIDLDEHVLSELDYKVEEVPKDIDDRQIALQAFWRRPWFRRIWVVQEFVYATEILVSCGDTEIDWIKLFVAAQLLLHQPARLFSGTKHDTELWKWNWQQTPAFHDIGAGVMCFVQMCKIRLRAWGYRPAAILGLRTKHLQEYGITLDHIGKNEGIRELHIPRYRGVEPIAAFFEAAKSGMLSDRCAGHQFPKLPLSVLLFNTPLYMFTNPKDRLYALLGLAIDVDHSEYSPQYLDSESVEDVCHRFSKRLILNGHGGEVLSLAGYLSQRSKHRKTMPSWVPDWTTRSMNLADHGETMCYIMGTHKLEVDERFESSMEIIDLDDKSNWLSEHDRRQGFHILKRLKELDIGLEKFEKVEEDQQLSWEYNIEPTLRIYQAALESKFECEIQDEKMYIKGSRVDKVSLVLPGALHYPPGFYHDMATVLLKEYPTGEPLREAVWRTLIANRAASHDDLLRKAPAKYGLQFESIKYQVNDWAVSAIGEPEPRLEYLQSLDKIRGRYNLCITHGGYIGLLPLTAKFGDEIAILHGCDTPFVIRSSKVGRSNFKNLIGECYVHGMMEGELLKDARFPVEKIELR